MVTAVIPVLNEEKTLSDVLSVVTSCRRIHKVVVIDDGSTDNSRAIIKKFPVKAVCLNKRRGKGEAVRKGTRGITQGIILFLDGDLVGLNHHHIASLLDPLLYDNVTMSIGLRDKDNVVADAIMPYFPLIGGERAIWAEVFSEISKVPLIDGWGLESVMNNYCRKKGLKIAKVRLPGVDHIGGQTMKYDFVAFLKEVYEVVLTRIKLFSVKYD